MSQSKLGAILHLLHVVAKYAYHKWIDSPRKWYPFLSVFYLTNACNFRCPYCSDGSGKPYYALSSATLPGAKVIALLQKIRRHTPDVVITGGEPLNHPDFTEIIGKLTALRFQNVVLTTNGYALEPYLPMIAPTVKTLVFSLDTLEAAKADAWYGIGSGTLDVVRANLERAATYPNKRYELVISSVVTPENIADLYAVYAYAQQQRGLFAAAPQLVGIKAHHALADNPAYRQFYDFLIKEKKNGARIFGTVRYLEYMRDLQKFTCHPFTMLVVSPLGEVFYPCLEIGHFADNLLQTDDLHQLRQAGAQQFGPQPACDTRCHSACALGFALALHHPWSLVQEGYLIVKQKLRNY
jgi:MoaA/NifB/PqqE/SkfB family radical SAM enzyme